MLKLKSYILLFFIIYLHTTAQENRKESVKEEVTKISEDSKNISNRRVLLIGIDGLQIEKTESLKTPNLDRLIIKKAYAGGDRKRNKKTYQTTQSAPGWATILTGTWANKHKIKGNENKTEPSRARTLFYYLKKSYPESYLASVVHWNVISIHTTKRDNKYIDYRKFKDKNGLHGMISDKKCTKLVVKQILCKSPLFTFIHLDDPDTTGHQNGFGAKYNRVIRVTDKYVGKLLDAVEKRQKQTGEDWLVIVTTDHGREKSGWHHKKGTSLTERTIFIAMNKKGNDLFQSATYCKIKNSKHLYKTLPQTSITPTILHFLGVPLEGKDFYSPSLVD